MGNGVLGKGLVLCSVAGVLAFACGGTSSTSHGSSGGTPGATAGVAGSQGGTSSTAGGASDGGRYTSPGDGGSVSSAGAPACIGLECDVPVCTDGTTRLTGTVFAPSGTLPLYNAVVFVPNGDVPALSTGPTCDRCGEPGVPVVTLGKTDAKGNFVLDGAPAGNDVPLVIQIGKWRRQLVLESVAACADNAIDGELTRLPRDQSEGDMPRIAIAAGAADQMECLPRRLGIADTELTTAAGQGRIHLFAGHHDEDDADVAPILKFTPSLNGGAALPSADTLWSDVDALSNYDLVLLSCEGDSFAARKPPAMRQALFDYLSMGGRVLASHWHHTWFSEPPPGVAPLGTWLDRRDPTEDGAPITASVNETFPKGLALAQWLVEVAASTQQGALNVNFSRDNLQAVNQNTAREWLTLANPEYPESPKSVQYMSFTAPVGAPVTEACGRGAFTDLHVSGASGAELQPPFPEGCEERTLSPQEKAIAFMLFELGSCIDTTDEP